MLMVLSKFGILEAPKNGRILVLTFNFSLQVDIGEYSANSIAWDHGSTVLAVGGDDHTIKLINTEMEEAPLESTLTGHEAAIHRVGFEQNTKNLISCGEEGEFKLWS